VTYHDDMKLARQNLGDDPRVFAFQTEMPDGTDRNMVGVVLFVRGAVDWKTGKADCFSELGEESLSETGDAVEKRAWQWAKPLFGNRADVVVMPDNGEVAVLVHIREA
jgi:hypothetical protein